MVTEAPLEEAMEGAHRRRERDRAQARRRREVERLLPHEEWVLSNPLRERTRFLDANGRIVHEKEGERGGIDWSSSALRALMGRVELITHNHPDGKSVGENDAFLAVALGAREVNAISSTRRHRLYRAGKAWPPVEHMDRVRIEERDRLRGEMLTARARGAIDDAQIEQLFHQVMWERVAARFPDQVRFEIERRGQ